MFPKSFDPIVDRVLARIGIDPNGVGRFLVKRKSASRVAANVLSLTRVVLAEKAIGKYEKARRKGNSKEMGMAALLIGFIIATDFIDGYIARKAKIDENKSGKTLDALCDVYLRFRLARSSIWKNSDSVALIRGAGELLLATSALPDVLKLEYESSKFGKYKAASDAAAVAAHMLGEIMSGAREEERSKPPGLLSFLDTASRVLGAGLAFADGFYRRISGRKMQH